MVNVSDIQLPGVDFPRVATNLQSSAKMAADHFLEHGFKHFAYFSLSGLKDVALHQQAFARAVNKAGDPIASFATKPTVVAEPHWNGDLIELGEWLRQLPKPVGILTWNAGCARKVLYTCQMAGFLVPERNRRAQRQR